MRQSLRLRLLIATSLSSAVVLALLGCAIYAAMSHLLLADYDASLIAKGRAIAATTEQRNGHVKLEFDPKQMPEFSAASHPDYFQIWLDDGRVLSRSESLAGNNLPMTDAAARAASGSLALPGTHHPRAIAFSFTPRMEGEENRPASKLIIRTCTIAVAGTPSDAHRLLGYLGWLLLATCSLAIVLSGALLLRITNQAVKPVKAVAHAIEQVRETDLSARLNSNGVPDELSPVVEKLNGLLDRLQQAFLREQAFTADVAHELRTPLAGLQTTLEVCRSRPRKAAEYETAIDDCQAMTQRMQAMVENLLTIARADAGQLSLARRRFSVCQLLRESWALFEHQADAKCLHVQWEEVSGSDEVETDPDKLQIVVQNMFDNAVSYVDRGGNVRIAVANHDERVEIEIVNSGSEVAATEVPHLFERFWRGDTSRSETGVHCGLGLSLAQRLIGLLSGRITIETTLGGDFVARVSLPAAAGDDNAVERTKARFESVTS